MQFMYAPCPNCKVSIKVDTEKKYQDCPECKFEFRTEDMQVVPIKTAPTTGGSLLDKLKANSQK